MKKMLILLMLILGLFILPSQSNALNLMESFFLKITINENDSEFQWEYTSPGKYEFEKGTEVIKSEVAKQEMLAIIKTLQLSEKAKAEEMVERLKKDKYPDIERLDIRWMTGDHKLFTWVWEKK
ncbi:hypothetical protein DS745_19680 [Anaerobacillus alkaliphilus]|uniref:Uncharacterized protein n=1 Tax=Anaerobacillus alkaliphilus TaxID=1548597 RepID=A0A4Q0VQ49_9BACI|nr:hypothetical protein [Anaerobacillus alkaliphilus]RXI98543.1 hypothetical protein DS745_19680 [Anaerobacillus alkaliphilus]